MKVNYITPTFVGLSHIGQIYSIAWLKKIGSCNVFDFNKESLKKFKRRDFTNEEFNLKKIKFNKKKLVIFNHQSQLIESKIIFFTYDTPINLHGKPNLNYIESYLKRIFKIKFKHKVKIFITTQTYPGFLDSIKKKYLKKQSKIELIYMVDTLKMGEAIKRFIQPYHLIFGCENKNKKFILKLFKKFKCKKFFYNIKEAELAKISINLHLYFTVNFANILEHFSSEIKCSFSKIINSLKMDPRIGKYAYINPSCGISGGHLERDAYYINSLIKNKNIKKIFNNFKNFNSRIKKNLKLKILSLRKKKNSKILIVGLSYKKNSFSIVGSLFENILKDRRFKIYVYDSYYPKINLNINQINNLNEGINNSNIIIYNYGSFKDIKLIKKFFKKKNNKILINISNENKEFLKNKSNIINYFLSETQGV